MLRRAGMALSANAPRCGAVRRWRDESVALVAKSARVESAHGFGGFGEEHGARCTVADVRCGEAGVR